MGRRTRRRSIAGTLQPLFSGTRATLWQDEQGYTHDVRVVYPDSLRVSAEDVANIPVTGTAMDARTGLPSRSRSRRSPRCARASGRSRSSAGSWSARSRSRRACSPGAAVGDVADATLAALDSLVLPAGYRTVFGGDVQNLNETKGYVLEAIVLAIVFIYLILASLFGSFVQPLAIMLSLPLSLLGVSLALLDHRGHAQRDVDDRHHHAHGARDEERHPADRLREPRAERGEGPAGARSWRQGVSACGRSS